MRRIALVGLCCLVMLTTCGGPNPAALQAYQALVKQLRAAGATVMEDQERYTSDFSGEDHHLTVDGGWVEVYAYATPEEANADAGHLSANGSTFSRDNSVSHSAWAIPPHFYKKDRLIVLYVGEDSQVRALLTHLLGPQFAGWS